MRVAWYYYVAAGILIFAFGRYSAPVKVKTVTKTVEVEKKTSQTDTEASRDKHKETTVTEIVRPDGTRETTTTTREDTEVHKTKSDTSTSEREKDTTASKEVTRETSRTTISAMYGLPVTGGVPVYGASISKPLLGPIAVGVWGLTPGVIGASVGLGF